MREYYGDPPEDNLPEFAVDRNIGENGDLLVTIENKSFYFECIGDKLVIRKYDLVAGIPTDDEGTIIFEEKYS